MEVGFLRSRHLPVSSILSNHSLTIPGIPEIKKGNIITKKLHEFNFPNSSLRKVLSLLISLSETHSSPKSVVSIS